MQARGRYSGGNRQSNGGNNYNVSGRRGGFGSGGRRGGKRGGFKDNGNQSNMIRKRRKDPKPENSKRYVKLRTKILSSNVKDNSRTKAIAEVIASIKNEGISTVLDTKDGSKLVQSCLKYSKHKTKNDMAMMILEDDLTKIATSKYGQFVINKLVKYGISRKYITQLEDAFIDNYSALLMNDTSKKMLHTHFESMNDYQILQLEERIYAKNSEMDEKVLEYIDNNFEVNLSPYQSYLSQFWEEIPADTKLKTMEIMKQTFDAFVQNRYHGFLLFAKVFDSIKLKERKKLLNSTVKGRVYELLSYNPNFFLVLVKVICSYDDPKNLKEFILNEVGQKFYDFVQEEDCIKFLNFLFSGNIDKAFLRRFSSDNAKKAIDYFKQNTGKKPVDKKLEEIYEYLLDEVDVTEQITNENLETNLLKKIQFCHLISFLLKTAIARSTNAMFVLRFIRILTSNTEKNLGNDEIDIDGTLITNPFTQRLVKKFVQSFDEAIADEKEKLEKKIEKFVEVLLDNLSQVVKTKAVFVILALIEHTSYSEKIKSAVRELIDSGEINANEEKKEVGLKILIKNVKVE